MWTTGQKFMLGDTTHRRFSCQRPEKNSFSFSKMDQSSWQEEIRCSEHPDFITSIWKMGVKGHHEECAKDVGSDFGIRNPFQNFQSKRIVFVHTTQFMKVMIRFYC